MSERKVLSKYYPADFDPSAIVRTRRKTTGTPVQVVRLMAPVSMKCMRCGEYIYKGRKFNARKETPDEKYLGNQIYRFYIRCTRCSAEIIFRTDPKNQDYVIVSGAKRNTEPWYQANNETDEQRLDRLEAEAAVAAGDESASAADTTRMEELEAKTLEAKREMDVADALDEIRTRNAHLARADRREQLEAVALARPVDEEKRQRQQDAEDAEAARRAFAEARAAAAVVVEEDHGHDDNDDEDAQPAWLKNDGGSSGASANGSVPATEATNVAPAPRAVSVVPPELAAPVPSFKRQVKKKKDHAALLGIKKKPSLV